MKITIPFALNHWYSTNMTTTTENPPVNARSLLLPYTLALVAAMIVVQIAIALGGSEITALSGGLTALVAVGILVWLWANRRPLAHIRFGAAIAHAIAYLVVTTSFTVHAIVLVVTTGYSGASPEAVSALLLGSPWFGATLVMSATWGLGLLIHLIGAVLGRGWED